MNKELNQEDIDALLESSSKIESSALGYSQNFEEESAPAPITQSQQQGELDQYGSEEFESYQESKRTFTKSKSRTDFEQSKKQVPSKTQLQSIKEEPLPHKHNQTAPIPKKAPGQPKAKTGVYFNAPPSGKRPGSVDKTSIPYNYARLADRERELLFTTISQENRNLKEEIRFKQLDYSKLDKAYKVLLQEKSTQAPSVREATLQKQLAALQTRHDKLQNLLKVEKEKNTFRATQTGAGFVPEQMASDREEELLSIIDKLKERLLSTHTELKTLQAKMNEGENYIDQLKRKMRRVEQLEHRMEKMAQQADTDRGLIELLQQKNKELVKLLAEEKSNNSNLEVQLRRAQRTHDTHSDLMDQLTEARRQKELLQQTLKQMSGTFQSVMASKKMPAGIEDSGELIAPR